MKNCNSGSKKNDLGTQGLSKLTEAMLLRSIIQVYALAIKMASQELFSWSSIYNVSIFIINSYLLYYTVCIARNHCIILLDYITTRILSVESLG